LTSIDHRAGREGKNAKAGKSCGLAGQIYTKWSLSECPINEVGEARYFVPGKRENMASSLTGFDKSCGGIIDMLLDTYLCMLLGIYDYRGPRTSKSDYI
jgi:hypothetical protein